MTGADTLTPRQVEALRAAYEAKLHGDGWLLRGFCRIWGIAPAAIMALERKGYLEMPHGRGRARLTENGRQLVEAEPVRFGLAAALAAAGHASESEPT